MELPYCFSCGEHICIPGEDECAHCIGYWGGIWIQLSRVKASRRWLVRSNGKYKSMLFPSKGRALVELFKEFPCAPCIIDYGPHRESEVVSLCDC